MKTNERIEIERAGERRKSGQSRGDRLREIKSEEGWMDAGTLLRCSKTSRRLATS